MSVILMSEIWRLAIETTPKMILIKLADHANDDGGSIYPSVERIRLAVGVASDSTIKRRLRQFKKLGILVEDQDAQSGRRTTGRGNYKIWRIDLEAARRHFPPTGPNVKPLNLATLAQAVDPRSSGIQPNHNERKEGYKLDQERGSFRASKGGYQDCKEGPDIVPESSRTINEPSSQIPDGICESALPHEEPIEAGASLRLLPVVGRQPRQLGSKPLFERFWTAYPRKVAKGRARKAWAKAITKANPETIIEGAARYAAEQHARDPEFTKHPTTWLAGECWLDESLKSRPRGQRQGAPSAFRAFARSAGYDPDTLD
jgi:hypothetical protein